MTEKTKPKKRAIPLGIKFIVGFNLLNILLWTIGQGGAVIAYDTVASWGFQDPRSILDPVIVEVNRGIGLSDMIIMMPLFMIGVVGLWQLKFYGAVASWMAFGCSIYWPTIYWICQHFYGQAGIKYLPTTLQNTIILSIIFGFTLWASWYLFRNYKALN